MAVVAADPPRRRGTARWHVPILRMPCRAPQIRWRSVRDSPTTPDDRRTTVVVPRRVETLRRVVHPSTPLLPARSKTSVHEVPDPDDPARRRASERFDARQIRCRRNGRRHGTTRLPRAPRSRSETRSRTAEPFAGRSARTPPSWRRNPMPEARAPGQPMLRFAVRARSGAVHRPMRQRQRDVRRARRGRRSSARTNANDRAEPLRLVGGRDRLHGAGKMQWST